MNITSKTLMTMAAAMAITLTGWAKTLPGVAPLSPEKLAKWRAEEMLANAPKAAAKSDLVFYTGKPYDADLKAYVFPFRNYSPDLCRWTVADPSGFPDGANNYCYAPTPNMGCDPLGLIKWDTLKSLDRCVTFNGDKSGAIYDVYNVKTDKDHLINIYYFNTNRKSNQILASLKDINGVSGDFSTNCHGSALDIAYNGKKFWLSGPEKNTVLADEYVLLEGPGRVNATIVDFDNGCPLHTAKITGGMIHIIGHSGEIIWSDRESVTTYSKVGQFPGPVARTLRGESRMVGLTTDVFPADNVKFYKKAE